MIKKTKAIFILLAIIFVVFSFLFFRDKRDDNTRDIEVPTAGTTEIQGTWRISGERNLSDGAENPHPKNDKLYISDQLVVIDERYTMKPSISAKYVATNEYFNYKYQTTIKFSEDRVKVFSISDGTKFYQDVIMLNQNKLLIPYNGIIYEANRESNQVEQKIINKYNQLYEKKDKKDNQKGEEEVAVQLGVKRKYMESGGRERSEYRTYFIKIPMEKPPIMYLTNDLVFHRDNGVWISKYEQVKEDKKMINRISVSPFPESDKLDKNNVLSSEYPMEITYIGPNFISVFNQIQKENYYNLYHLDKLFSMGALGITDVAGKSGEEILMNLLSEKNNQSNSSEASSIFDLKNIGVRRSEGRWLFVTTLNEEKDEKVQVQDQKLSIVPTIDIRLDNKSGLKWSDVKNLTSDAIDTVSSPDNNILIVQEEDELLIYRMNGTKVIATIPFDKNDKIVLSQWALDSYADIWEKEFTRTPRVPVSFNAN